MPPQTKATGRPPSTRSTDIGLWVVGILLALSGAVWAAAHLAALATGRPVRLGLAGAGGLLIRWGLDPFIDGPPTANLFGRSDADVTLPAPDLAIQVTAGALVLAVAGIVAGGWLLLRGHGRLPRRRPDRARQSARWGSKRDLAPILVRPGEQDGRLVIGDLAVGLGRRLLVAVEELHSVFVLGPTGSRKTSALAIPALLEWQGPAIATSVKPDLLRATKRARWLRGGEVWVFDPAGYLGDEGAGWDPLAGITTWAQARELATWLVEASAEHKQHGDATKGFFELRGRRPLAAAIWAAVLLGKGGIGQVKRWLDELASPAPGNPRDATTAARYNDAAEDILTILGMENQEEAIAELKSVLDETPNQRSGTITSAQVAVDVFGDANVLAACSPGRTMPGGTIDPERLLDGAGTLYLYAPLHEQDRLRPVFESLVMSVVRTAQERTARTGRPLERPFLVLLDEAGNVAPIRQLAQLASTGSGQAIQLLSIFQDYAQVSDRYGKQAPTVVNNHRAKLLLSGLADPSSLDYVSGLIGEAAEVEESRTDSDDRTSRTEHLAYRRLAPPALLRETVPGEGVLVYGHLPAAKVRLRWFETDKDLVSLAGTPEERRRASGQHPGDPVRGDRRVVYLGRRRRRRRAA